MVDFNKMQNRTNTVAIIWSFLLYLSMVACSSVQRIPDVSANPAIVFQNVNVISMESPEINPGQTVLVLNDRIQAISPDINLPPGTRIIDGTGKYLIPGLVDMHVHISHFSDLPLFVANGVTTVRNMWGTGGFMRMLGFPNQLALKRKIQSENLIAPTIFTAGPILNSGSLFMENIGSPEVAEEAVLEQQASGYDFIKVYDDLSLESYDAILAAGQTYGIPVAGHVPKAVPVIKAIEGGQVSIEHLTGFLDFDAAKLLVAEDSLPDLGRACSRNEIFLCPTIVMPQRRTWCGRSSMPEIKYMPLRSQLLWNVSLLALRCEVFFKYETYQDQGYVERSTDLMKQVTGILHANGAKILVGTDVGNPNVVPGFSTLDELDNLVDAGLTNFEALEAATVNPAKCIGKDTVFGKVKAGYQADLVLLEENPLLSIRNTRKQAGVMVRGVWLSKEEIEKILDQL